MNKSFIIVILIFIAFLGLYSFLHLGRSGNIILPVFSASNQPFSNIVDERLTLKQPLNLLLLGYGGGTHDGSYLTDSMILAHLDPQTQTTTLITIPRDIWINLPSNSSSGAEAKINAAYAIGLDDVGYPNKPDKYTGPSGAGNMAKYAVSALTGLQVDRFLALDFSGFIKFIDTLGGVDVTLTQPFDDYAYPLDGQETAMCGKAWDTMTPEEKTSPLDLLPTVFPCRYEHLHLDAGLNHLDGATALKFVRSRHSVVDGTDFGRSNRQRQLISAVIKKTLSLPSLPKAVPLYQSLKNHIATDLTVTEITAVVAHLDSLKSYQLQGVALTNQNIFTDSFTAAGQYILVPTSGPGQWDFVHEWIKTQLIPSSSSSASLH